MKPKSDSDNTAGSDCPSPNWSPSYVPFGEEWEKEVMKNPKNVIVAMLKKACIGRDSCKEGHKDAWTKYHDLREQVRLTLMENLHLADGDQCTLKRLKDSIGFDLDSPESVRVEVCDQ